MYQQQPPVRRSAVPVVLIVIASVVAAVALLVVVVAVAFLQSPEAAGWDRPTIQACEQVRDAHGGLDGEGAAVIQAASASDQAALREAAARYLDEPNPNALDMRESVLRIARWCLENGLN